jgi:hypothetical protein
VTLLTSRCPLCLATRQMCTGHGPASDVQPVDLAISERRTTVATEEPNLKVYRYNVYGNEVEGQLTEEHAQRIGAVPLDEAGDGAETGDAASTTQTSTGATTKARTSTKNK